jgi:hypothetical protein
MITSFIIKDRKLIIKLTYIKAHFFPFLFFWKQLLLTVNVWTLGIQIKIGMSLAVVLDPPESITAITFLSKKDSTIAIYEGAPHLIFNHWFIVKFLLIYLISYSNVIDLCLIYPNHHILSHETSKIYINTLNSIIIWTWNKMENETRGRHFEWLRIKYFIPKKILKGFMNRTDISRKFNDEFKNFSHN